MHLALAFAARHARLVLILGLLAGIALPRLADSMRPWIGEMVAGLLFLAALRVGPTQALGALGDLWVSLGIAGLFQLAAPLAAASAVALFGLGEWALATFLVLMLAAPPVSGSPHLTIMTGNDPAPALRQLVVGTALVPLTVLPVFWLTSSFGDPGKVFAAAGGLMLVIAGAAAFAFTLRLTVLRQPTQRALSSIDGLSAIAMAVVVVGLMSAVGPALRQTPLWFATVLAAVCAANLAIQIAVALCTRRMGHRKRAAANGITAGNRNVALFLTVLPQQTIDPMLLYIGCYQIPMYLTPAVLGRFYRP